MLLNLLSSNNFVSYNVFVAQTFGLAAAVYLNELVTIVEKANRKNKVFNGFIRLDRDYIKYRTTLSLEEQLDIDSKLVKMGLMTKNETGEFNLNIEDLFSIIVDNNESLVKDISEIMLKVKRATKATKTEAISDKLKYHIQTNNAELREAYVQWIDSVVAKEGWMSATSVICGQQLVDKYSNRDLDVALSIVRIAAINGYRDLQWAINDLKKNYYIVHLNDAPVTNNSITQNMNRKVATEVF